MSSKDTYSIDDLTSLAPQFSTLVGIDSDGCVFDSMATKQCEHFHPLIIEFWHLQEIEPQLRQAAEFFNLYSRWRGQNRFIALLEVFKALPGMPGVLESGVDLPPWTELEAYVKSGLALGNPSLADEVERTGDSELTRLLEWSVTVSESIDTTMAPAPLFDGARAALETIQQHSDAIVVSQTPEAALVREWRLHKIDHLVRVIAGQELGSKAEHLRLASDDRYDLSNVILVGDALGDLRAAQAAEVCFYPINPGHEVESWQRFTAEAYPLFLSGTYAGEYQTKRVDEFQSLLTDTLPWAQ